LITNLHIRFERYKCDNIDGYKRIYHVYTMYIPIAGMYMVYSMYVQRILKFNFLEFICILML
jgi:hypothetical protein